MGKNEISLADNLINIINTARENAFKKVNEEKNWCSPCCLSYVGAHGGSTGCRFLLKIGR